VVFSPLCLEFGWCEIAQRRVDALVNVNVLYLYDELYKDSLGELDDAAFASALEEYIAAYGEPPGPPPGALMVWEANNASETP
jgi:hypothetical protein